MRRRFIAPRVISYYTEYNMRVCPRKDTACGNNLAYLMFHPPLSKLDARIFVAPHHRKFHTFSFQSRKPCSCLLIDEISTLNVMYSDEDGTASKESETIYWYRVRTLLSWNSVLSLVGCILAALRGEYRGESMIWGLLIFWSRLLWASSPTEKLPVI